MAKNTLVLALLVPITLGHLCLQAVGQSQGTSQSFGPDTNEGNVGCTAPLQYGPKENVHIPPILYPKAKKKAHLMDLLRDSIYDDAKGITNVARDKEIRKILNDLRR